MPPSIVEQSLQHFESLPHDDYESRWKSFSIYTRCLSNWGGSEEIFRKARHADVLAKIAGDELEPILFRFQAMSRFAYLLTRRKDYEKAKKIYADAKALYESISHCQRKLEVNVPELMPDQTSDLWHKDPELVLSRYGFFEMLQNCKIESVGEIMDKEIVNVNKWSQSSSREWAEEQRIARLTPEDKFIQDVIMNADTWGCDYE